MDDQAVFGLSRAVWTSSPSRLNSETSYGMLAWEGGPSAGDTQTFDRTGWARLSPGYARIRRPGVFDEAPPSLVWLVEPQAHDTLRSIVAWAEQRCPEGFVTSHAAADVDAERVLGALGYVPDPSEPFGIYLQRDLRDADADDLGAAPPDGYVLTTMADLDDVELRAEAHRVAWEGSRRGADDVRRTMAQWPYRADLDVVLLTADGAPVGSALAWYDESYEYGEFEPVGVAPEHRRRGLARAMLRFGMDRLRRAGASYAVVGARGDDDYPLPRQIYGSVGFEVVMTQRIVRKRG